MAVAHAALKDHGRLSRLLTTDFCPWANRFVYWLKEPVGWFALATLASALIGLYLSPIGWTMAASLSAIIVIGIAWPWVAVRVTQCGLHPEVSTIHEEASCKMVVSVHNRIPLPVWGLAIEGYLDCAGDESSLPTVGLDCVPPLCTADYSISVTPSLRGCYPIRRPSVACSFPFGIWTARRELSQVKPLVVWPKVYSILGSLPAVGRINADQGDGSRGGRSGDFVGVRPMRRGDSAKHVNWVASARSDSLIVTERGGPQTVELDVWIDTQIVASRHSLARRIRVAASLLCSLHDSRTRSRVQLGEHALQFGPDVRGRRRMLDTLANVPADGQPCPRLGKTPSGNSIAISEDATGDVLIRLDNAHGGRRAGGASRTIRIAADDDLAAALAMLWKEVRDGSMAA